MILLDVQCVTDNQKLDLCEALLSLGDWTHAKLLMEKLSWIHLHNRFHRCHHFVHGYSYCASFASWCPEDYRQKLGLCETLLSLGDWTHAKLLMEKLSWIHLHNRSHRCHHFLPGYSYCASFASWCPEDYRQKLGLWEAFLSLGRDANQSDFIVFSTTNRAKYDNTILPIKIRFSPNVCLPLSLSLFFLCISYQTITLVWHFISLLSSGETLPK